MCSVADTLREKAQWTGVAGDSRAQLFTLLESELIARAHGTMSQFSTDLIPSSIVLPGHRLETLLEQAIAYQKSNCLYHNPATNNYSLYSDHSCQRYEQRRWDLPTVIFLAPSSHALRFIHSASIPMKFGMLPSHTMASTWRLRPRMLPP